MGSFFNLKIPNSNSLRLEFGILLLEFFNLDFKCNYRTYRMIH